MNNNSDEEGDGADDDRIVLDLSTEEERDWLYKGRTQPSQETESDNTSSSFRDRVSQDELNKLIVNRYRNALVAHFEDFVEREEVPAWDLATLSRLAAAIIELFSEDIFELRRDSLNRISEGTYGVQRYDEVADKVAQLIIQEIDVDQTRELLRLEPTTERRLENIRSTYPNLILDLSRDYNISPHAIAYELLLRSNSEYEILNEITDRSVQIISDGWGRSPERVIEEALDRRIARIFEEFNTSEEVTDRDTITSAIAVANDVSFLHVSERIGDLTLDRRFDQAHQEQLQNEIESTWGLDQSHAAMLAADIIRNTVREHERYVGSIDQGTTGTRFMVFDHAGEVVANAYEKHEQIYPEPGWVEHDANEIWRNTKHVIETALNEAGLDAEQLEAIGITNQRETTVVWDAETGKPVHNALVWQDRRTTDRIEEIQEAGKVEWIREKTGLECDAYFSATKAEWILDNADLIKLSRSRPEDIRDRAESGELMLGTIDSWLIYKLTGNHITDVTNASRTMLYNIHDNAWDEELLEEFNIPASMLPEVRPSSDNETYGSTGEDCFLGADIPVAGALGDQQAALFGQTCFDEGDAKNTYGTGSFMLMNTGEEAVASEHGLLTTIGFQRSGEPVQYALEGAIFITGAAIEWLEDMTLIESAAETEELARSVDSTDDVYVVPAFAGLGAPHWDSRARGTIVGMTRGTRREHVVRATLESIAYQTRDVAEAMVADADIDMSSLRVDGGAVKNNFLCQLQADILNTKIVRPVVDETTALGSAYAAGLAVGYWETISELRDNWQVDREFEPDPEADYEANYERWCEAVARAEDWARYK